MDLSNYNIHEVEPMGTFEPLPADSANRKYFARNEVNNYLTPEKPMAWL